MHIQLPVDYKQPRLQQMMPNEVKFRFKPNQHYEPHQHPKNFNNRAATHYGKGYQRDNYGQPYFKSSKAAEEFDAEDLDEEMNSYRRGDKRPLNREDNASLISFSAFKASKGSVGRSSICRRINSTRRWRPTGKEWPDLGDFCHQILY